MHKDILGIILILVLCATMGHIEKRTWKWIVVVLLELMNYYLTSWYFKFSGWQKITYSDEKYNLHPRKSHLLLMKIFHIA